MISLQQIHRQFDTQDKCAALLVSLRWPDGVRCPRCGTDKVFKITHRAWNWVCKSGAETIDKQTGEVKICKRQGYRFSPLVGTVFENTNYPLPVWFEVIYLICQSKKGMSAMQVQRMLTENGRKTAYKTAFYICYRVRAMLDNPEFGPLMDQVEVKEPYIGGKENNRHFNKKQGGRGTAGKIPVVGAISRKGNVVCEMIENADTETLTKSARKTVSDKVELVATMNIPANRYLKYAPHRFTLRRRVRAWQHSYSEHDSFWALLKRGIIGTYHNVSKKYLPLYLNEFQWRKDPDIFIAALRGC